jgi:flagellar basal-body rod modification protein FlgD
MSSPIQKMSNIEKAEKSLLESRKELAEEGENAVKKSSEMMFKSFEDAIKLFVASIKYQDPMDPVDTSEMSQQMFQLSQAQGQHAMLEKQDELNTIMKTGQILNASHLQGQKIEVNTNKFSLNAGGDAELGYYIPAGATKVTILIADEKGRPVYEQNVEPKPGQKALEPGKQDLKWKGEVNTSHGKTLTGGKSLENGEFRIRVIAYDEKGIMKETGSEQALAIQTTVKEKLTGSDFTGKIPRIVVGNNKLPLTSIVSIQGLTDNNGDGEINRYELMKTSMKGLSVDDSAAFLKSLDEQVDTAREQASKELNLEKKLKELSTEQYESLSKKLEELSRNITQGV